MFHFLTDSRAQTRRARRPAVSQLEALENRTCLSANFSASVTAGTLNVQEIAGSGSYVTISENAAHDHITVAGSGLGTSAVTLINGVPSYSFSLARTPINKIIVNYASTPNANDALLVQDVSLPNGLTVALASKSQTTPLSPVGNNTVQIERAQFSSASVTDPVGSTAHDHVTFDQVTGNVSVTEADGNGDGIRVVNSSIGKSTFTQGAGLADRVRFDTVTSASGLTIGQNGLANVTDSAWIDNVYANGPVNYTGGSGPDYTELSNVDSNGGTVDGGSSGNNILDSDGTYFGFDSILDYQFFINSQQ